ncbi:MAG: hypothetical protein H7836_17595 [Magnetococcus sp. YQC-3]
MNQRDRLIKQILGSEWFKSKSKLGKVTKAQIQNYSLEGLEQSWKSVKNWDKMNERLKERNKNFL